MWCFNFTVWRRDDARTRGMCAFSLPTEGCVVRPRPSPRGTTCQPACVRSQLPSPCRSSEGGEQQEDWSNESSGGCWCVCKVRSLYRSSHRLVLEVLRRVFKLWPKIDGHLKRGQVKVQLTKTNKNKNTARKQRTTRTDRAALVEWDGGEVEAFEQVLKGNALAHSVFEEYHLKKQKPPVNSSLQQQVFWLDFILGGFPHVCVEKTFPFLFKGPITYFPNDPQPISTRTEQYSILYSKC